jgi:hypothetical protein
MLRYRRRKAVPYRVTKRTPAQQARYEARCLWGSLRTLGKDTYECEGTGWTIDKIRRAARRWRAEHLHLKHVSNR